MNIYNPFEICKHNLISIDFIASVYELSDNTSYYPVTSAVILDFGIFGIFQNTYLTFCILQQAEHTEGIYLS